MEPVRTVLLMGKPAAGKGTQAKLLADAHDWHHAASGDYFRELAKRGDALGRNIGERLASGKLLPDAFITHHLLATLFCVPERGGLVFDGLGRTEHQAREFREMLAMFGRQFTVVSIDVSDAVATARMQQRAAAEHRVDSDSLRKIGIRLHDYEQLTRPAIDYFQNSGLLSHVNGEQSPEEVHRAILKKLCVPESVPA